MTGKHKFNRKSGIKFLAICSVFLMGIFTIIASGGGGGGSATINVTQINAANAEAVATDAYLQGKSAVNAGTGSFDTVKSKGTTDQNAASTPQALALPCLVLNFMDTVDLSPRQAKSSIPSLETETLYGACGGQADLVISIDPLDKEFSLEADFSDYCMDPGVVLNGVMEISGEIDLILDRVLSFAVSFSSFNMVITDTGDSSTISGVMSITVTGLDAITALMDMSLTDDTTGKTHLIDDLTVSVDGLISSVMTFTMSGAYTNPDNGVFSIVTTTPFMINKTDVMPYQGVLLVTAADNTKAELTILSTTSYQVRADTDGDGTYDFDTGIKSW